MSDIADIPFDAIQAELGDIAPELGAKNGATTLVANDLIEVS